MGMDNEELKDKIERARKDYLQGLDELESEVKILSDRIKKAREIVPTIQTMEDVEKFNNENDLEEGLEHIEIF